MILRELGWMGDWTEVSDLYGRGFVGKIGIGGMLRSGVGLDRNLGYGEGIEGSQIIE